MSPAESEPEDVKPVMEGREEASGGESSEPAAKSVKSGKQYQCPHCSYSADKKVSLNRHMRMHSSSPASQTGSTDTTGESHLVDRYCQDCDIRYAILLGSWNYYLGWMFHCSIVLNNLSLQSRRSILLLFQLSCVVGSHLSLIQKDWREIRNEATNYLSHLPPFLADVIKK